VHVHFVVSRSSLTFYGANDFNLVLSKREVSQALNKDQKSKSTSSTVKLQRKFYTNIDANGFVRSQMKQMILDSYIAQTSPAMAPPQVTFPTGVSHPSSEVDEHLASSSRPSSSGQTSLIKGITSASISPFDALYVYQHTNAHTYPHAHTLSQTYTCTNLHTVDKVHAHTR